MSARWMTLQTALAPALASAMASAMVAFAAGGCDPRAEVILDGPTRSDSAGVPVVTNLGGAAERVPEWQIGPDPVLEIGQVDGTPEYLLVRVSTATVLSDGTIVLADTGSQELRFFDQSGQHIRTVGREGDGPGEFASLLGAFPFADDSLLAFDGFGSRRVSVFDRNGVFVRSNMRAESFGRYPRHLGVLSDGSMVGSPQETRRFPPRPDEPIIIAGPGGQSASVLGPFPGTEVANSGGALPFGRQLHAHASGDRIAVANSDAFSVRLYDPAGELVRIVRLLTEPRPLTDAARDRFLDEVMSPETGFAQRDYIEELLRESERHSTLPEIAAVHLDRTENLWVQQYTWSGPVPEESRWFVFDPDGILTATVVLPAGFRMAEIGADYVLEIGNGPFDVQVFRMHRLVKR